MPFAAIIPVIAAVASAVGGASLVGGAIAGGLGALGLTGAEAALGGTILGETASTVLGGSLIGAAGGALGGGLEGGGKGALIGGLTGGLEAGAITLGPGIGAELGIGTAGGDLLAGVGSGLVSSMLTGGSPLTGIEQGGIAGAGAGIAGALGIGGGGATAPGGVGAGPSPAAISTPASGGGVAGDTGAASVAATGDILPLSQQGTIFSGMAPTGTSQFTAATTGGTISGGAQGGGTISGPSPTPTLGAVTPDLSITPTATEQAAQLGAITSPTGVAAGYAPTGNFISPTGATVSSTEQAGLNLGNIGNWLLQHPTTLLSGAGLLMSMMQTNQEQSALNQLEQQAAGASTMARSLEAPLFSGVLPPGAQQTLNLSRSDQQGIVKSQYAAMGMSGSTGEADALSAIDQNIAAEQFGMENSLFQQAAGYSQEATTDYENILGQQRLQDEDLSNALSKFVAAIGGSSAG